MNNNNELYEYLYKKYGDKLQSIIQMEELSELSKEISKSVRGKHNKENMTEEMADVTIIIEQLKYRYDISDEEINIIMKEKIERTKKL